VNFIGKPIKFVLRKLVWSLRFRHTNAIKNYVAIIFFPLNILLLGVSPGNDSEMSKTWSVQQKNTRDYSDGIEWIFVDISLPRSVSLPINSLPTNNTRHFIISNNNSRFPIHYTRCVSLFFRTQKIDCNLFEYR